MRGDAGNPASPRIVRPPGEGKGGERSSSCGPFGGARILEGRHGSWILDLLTGGDKGPLMR